MGARRALDPEAPARSRPRAPSLAARGAALAEALFEPRRAGTDTAGLQETLLALVRSARACFCC